MILNDLDTPLKELGLLLGLFNKDQNGNLTFNKNWFSYPLNSIYNVGKKPNELFALLNSIFPPSSFEDDSGNWYLLESDFNAKTNYYLVINEEKFEIGLGLLNFNSTESLNYFFSVYLPVLTISTSGTSLSLNNSSSNLNVSFSLTQPDNKKFTVSNSAGEKLVFGEFVYQILISNTGNSPKIKSDFKIQGIDPVLTTIKKPLKPTEDIFISGIANFFLQKDEVKLFLQKIIFGEFTIGDLLVALQLVIIQNNEYILNPNLNTVLKKNPTDFIKEFFDTLLELDVIRFPIGKGSVGLIKKVENAISKYGINFQLPDLSFNVGSEKNGFLLNLQLGKWLASENDATSWITRTDNTWYGSEGINVFLLEESNSNFTFKPSFEAISLGIDIYPSASNSTKTLINVGGFQLGFVQTRFMFTMNNTNTQVDDYGFAMLFGDLGIPLGPGFKNANGKNPVAQNLLASGSQSTGNQNQSVNPTFSVSLAYTRINGLENGPEVQLYDLIGIPTNQIWIPIQRAFGPLQCRSIGVSWNQDTTELLILFDGSVALPAFKVDLIGLTIGIPAKTPADIEKYDLNLNGLNLELKSGTTEIKASLRKNYVNNVVSYEGDALIKIGKFLVSAKGAYTTINGNPSLFIYACLNTPLGGPPIFFIEGLAAGFGYNRDLILPDVNQIESFPLISGLSSVSGQTPTLTESTPVSSALQSLGNWVPPKLGQYWLAAGLKFSSFKTINTRAVFALKLGQSTQFSLTGISNFKMPKPPANKVYANIEIGFQAIFNPDEGYFSAIAVLTSKSYLFTENCKLTGGIAFKTWYKGSYKGDFVLTVGGYHPSFQKPAHYPSVPRLGFHWPVSNEINISGGAYFALTPSCAMAGGWLSASYHNNIAGGRLSASFNVNTDIIIRWKPFNFLASFGISISASYSHKVAWWTVTISAHISASLVLWGPPTGGTFRVKYKIVSVTINFGASGKTRPTTINWSEFKTSLPEPNETIKLQAEKGLISTSKDSSGNEVWNISKNGFQFNLETAIPISSVSYNNNGQAAETYNSTTPVNVRPMGATNVSSVISIVIKKESADMEWTDWQKSTTLSSLPEALWGGALPQPIMQYGIPITNPQPAASAKLVNGLLTGIEGIKPVKRPLVGLPTIQLATLPAQVIDDDDSGYLPLSPLEENYKTPDATDKKSLETIATSIMDDSVVNQRKEIFETLGSFGMAVTTNEPLTNFANNINTIFQVNPLIGDVGAQSP